MIVLIWWIIISYSGDVIYWATWKLDRYFWTSSYSLWAKRFKIKQKTKEQFSNWFLKI